MTDVCIYCTRSIIEISEEHIIPNSFGAPKQSNHIVCRKCNSEMGEQFEADFCKQFNYFRVIFGVTSDRGEIAPPEKELTTPSGIKYDLYHGGIPVLSNPEYLKQQMTDGTTKIGGKYRNWREAKKHIKGFFNRGANEIEVEFIKEYLNEPLIIQTGIGGDCTFRSIGKIAFNYLATKLGNDFVLASKFDALRKYIRYGEKLEKKIVYFDYFYTPFPSAKIGIIDHGVMLQKKSDDDGLFGIVRLYGSFQFVCLLIEEFDKINSYGSFYAFDPILEKESEHNFEPFSDIEKPDIMAQIHRSTPEVSFSFMKYCINKIMIRHQLYAKKRRIDEIIQESITEVWKASNGRVLENNGFLALIDRLSREVMKLRFKLPEKKKYILHGKEDIDRLKNP